MDVRAVLAILAGLAFVPPLLFALWVRAHERHQREPLHAVLMLFVYGGTLGIALALLLNRIFRVQLVLPNDSFGFDATFFAVVVVAPVVEEVAKGLGFGLARRYIRELEDGIIYGVAVGVGFAATENFFYGLQALRDHGIELAMQAIAVRIFSSMLLHACASAILGFGYAVMLRRGGVVAQLLPAYLVAVIVHAGYNFLTVQDSWWAFGLAITLVLVTTGALRQRIRHLDGLPHAAPGAP